MYEKPQALHRLQPADRALSKHVVQWLHIDRADVLQTWLIGKVDGTEQACVIATERIDGVDKVGSYLGPDLFAGEAQRGFLDAVEMTLGSSLIFTAFGVDDSPANSVCVDLAA